jgi:hypothetical protein
MLLKVLEQTAVKTVKYQRRNESKKFFPKKNEGPWRCPKSELFLKSSTEGQNITLGEKMTFIKI